MSESVRVVRSVALVVRDERARVLIVRRPADDDDLPNVWGLPAASLRAGEDWHDAVRRASRDKLGVEVEVGAELGRGTQVRGARTLEMRLYDAAITGGVPAVPQDVPGVTQYVEWRWGRAADLEPGAERGSLCCRLYLERSGAGSRAGRAEREG